jgi:rod shape-determining protein MreB and related proteins
VPVEAIIAAVRDTLDRTPPELASDIMDRGMVLVGGVALLRGLDERLRQETGVPVHVAEEPMACVVMGSGRFLEEIEFDRGAISSG